MADPLPPPPEAPPPDPESAPAPWEAENKPAAPAAGTASGARPTARWQEKDRTAGKRSQIAITITVLFALIGIAVGLFFYIRKVPQVVFEVIPVSQYKKIAWAANPTADADAERLSVGFQAIGARESKAIASQEAKRLRERLKALADRREKSMVIYITALAVVRDGQTYLLAGDAPIDQPKDLDWVSLAEVLEAVATCPSDRKALFLDIAHPLADPFRGPFDDDVASRLDLAFTTSPPPYPVLCSCSPGQFSLAIPERGESAFAWYIAEGLPGPADGYRNGERDKKVSFAELAEYVRRRVGQWAVRGAGAQQLPKAYGPEGDDFILNFSAVPPPPAPEGEPPAPKAPPRYPDDLRKGWQERDAARAGAALLLAPDAITDLEAALLHAERLYLGGLGDGRPNLDEARRRLAGRVSLLPDAPPATFADLRAGRPDPPKELKDAVAEWMRLRFPLTPAATTKTPPSPPRPEDLAKAQQALTKLLVDKADKIEDAAWLIWLQLTEDRAPSREKLVAAADAMASEFMIPRPGPTAEILLLRQLRAAELHEDAYPKAVRQLLRAERAFADASAATIASPAGAFHAVRKILDEGDGQKRSGEAKLFAAKTAREVEDAEKTLVEASVLLERARDRAITVRTAREMWAAAAARLHATLPTMIAADRPKDKDWLQAATFAAEAADLLQYARGGELDFDRLADTTRALRAATDRLGSQADDDRALDAAVAQRPSPEALAEARLILTAATASGKKRDPGAEGARKLSATLFEQVRHGLDLKQTGEYQLTPKPVEDKTAQRFARDRAHRRADASFALLRIAGIAPAIAGGEIVKLRDAVAVAPDDTAKRQTFTDRLRKAWTVDVPAAAAAAAKERRWEAVERILRAAPAGLDGIDAVRGFDAMFRTEESHRREWLAGRFGEYGKLRGKSADARIFFDRLEKDYRHSLPSSGQ